MNMTKVLTRIKADLGLYAIALPFDNPDDVMRQIIEDITLETFSIYCPFREKLMVDTRDLERIESEANFETFLLPEWQEKKIIDVEDVKYDESMFSGVGYWGGTIPMVTSNIVTQSILANANAQLTRELIPAITFEYMHPRKLRLFNLYNSCKIVVTLLETHYKSLVSIPDSAAETVERCVELDVKRTLYNTLKHYNEIESAYGRINLRIDEWANAEQDRQELLNQWDDSYHEDRKQLYWL